MTEFGRESAALSSVMLWAASSAAAQHLLLETAPQGDPVLFVVKAHNMIPSLCHGRAGGIRLPGVPSCGGCRLPWPLLLAVPAGVTAGEAQDYLEYLWFFG